LNELLKKHINHIINYKIIYKELLKIMETLPDPCEDRVMKDVLPPPQKPIPRSKLFPNKSKILI
jgi:hypothetical protein